jgi:Flp pilus assembly pilin Flp
MATYIFEWLTARLSSLGNERGATAAEYGLLLAFIAAIVVAVITGLGEAIVGAFQDAIDAFG